MLRPVAQLVIEPRRRAFDRQRLQVLLSPLLKIHCELLVSVFGVNRRHSTIRRSSLSSHREALNDHALVIVIIACGPLSIRA